jgi:hypothetical protein
MKEKRDEKMNRVKTGFILLLILLCSGIGVTAYVNHTGYLMYDKVYVNQELHFSGAPTTDHTAVGITTNFTVGESVTFGQALYMKGDGKLWKSDANSTSTMPCVAIALGSISADVAGNVLKIGFIRDDTWNWTVGGLVFASWTTGGVTQTRPDGTGSQVQIVGYAVSADVIYFNPSYVLVEVS